MSDQGPADRTLAQSSVTGRATLYRLFDIGYEIDLAHAASLLAAAVPERTVPLRGEARAIVIPNPPLTVPLGVEALALSDGVVEARVAACLFDFGVASLRLTVPVPAGADWRSFVAWGGALDIDRHAAVFERWLTVLRDRVQPAIVRPSSSPVTEDYVVLRVTRLADAGGQALEAGGLPDTDIAALLLNEHRPLTAETRQALLPYRFSYTPQDLTVLSWDSALVIEPQADDLDIEFILEMANAQILELRVFDAVLDGQLASMYTRLGSTRRGRWRWGRRFQPLLTELHVLVADATEVVERVENALKVTNDVFLARVYMAALQLFRSVPWRAGIERKLNIVRGAYAMLNAEAQAARGEALEAIIVLLILIELVLGLLR